MEFYRNYINELDKEIEYFKKVISILRGEEDE